MSIAVVCSQCSAKLNAPDSAAGKKVKCPKCQGVIAVPEPLPLAPEFEVVDDEPQTPKKPRAVVQAAVEADDEDEQPRRARDEDDDEDYDDRPKKKKKKQSDEGNSMMTRNIVGGVVLVALLGVAGFVYYDRFKKKDETATSSGGSDEAGAGNPRIKGGAPKLPQFTSASGAPGGGGAGGQANPGGNAGAGKPNGTPGQPVTFISPSGFKVTFPGPYVVESPPQQLKDKLGLPVVMQLAADPILPQAFIAASVDVSSKKTAADKKSAYENAIKVLIEEEGKAPAVSRKTIMVNGRNWEEIVGKEGKTGTSINRLLMTDTHIIIIAVAHRTGTPAANAVKKYFESVELTQ